MRVIYMTEAGSQTIQMSDDTQFVMNQPHGFVRLIENTPQGIRSWYFNMQHLVAIGPGDGAYTQ